MCRPILSRGSETGKPLFVGAEQPQISRHMAGPARRMSWDGCPPVLGWSWELQRWWNMSIRLGMDITPVTASPGENPLPRRHGQSQTQGWDVEPGLLTAFRSLHSLDRGLWALGLEQRQIAHASDQTPHPCTRCGKQDPRSLPGFQWGKGYRGETEINVL